MKRLISVISLALCMALLFTGCAAKTPINADQPKTDTNKYAIVQTSYPQMAKYPDESKYYSSSGNFNEAEFDKAYNAWRDGKSAQRNQLDGYNSGMDDYYAALIRQMTGDGSENRIFSPLNIYMALCMLAEITDGNSRAQILELLGTSDIVELRTKADAIWNSNYSDDGAVTSILANSLWLNENINFNLDTMETLSDVYHTSSFKGEMGSADFNQALRTWLNEQTGGLLEEQASGIELDERTILALASTIYFQAKWNSEFSKNATDTDTFHALSGDIDCKFMHKNSSMSYYWADNFSAVCLNLEGSGGMWLILPDEGISFDELLENDDVFDLCSGKDWANSKYLTVNLSVPQFDVSSDIDLIDELKALGITDVFSTDTSDFSPMTANNAEAYISQAKHAARVMIDEEGCTAAAYTVMAATGSAMPPAEKIDFILDRPFMFMITSQDNSMLFTGTVANP